LRCFLNVASLLQSRMPIGNEFQADGAETAKALSVNRRRVCGIMKSPLDLERSRLSVHGLHSSHKYNGAVPRETRYIKTHSLNLMRLSIGSQCKLYKAVMVRHGRSRSFKVIEIGINRKPVRDLLLAVQCVCLLVADR